MNKLSLAAAAVLLSLCAATLNADTDRTRIHEEAEQVNPLLPGMRAPAFEVRDARGEPVTFDPDRMQKPMVLTFYRGGWCPYCNLHLAELRNAEIELSELGYDIWFVSVDKPEMLHGSLEQPDIEYRVLSDSGLIATRAFGIAFRVPDDLVEKYLDHGIDLEAASGEDHHVLPAPSLFLIGRDGTIRFQYTNPDYKQRLHPDVLLAAARVHQRDVSDRLRRQYEASRKE